MTGEGSNPAANGQDSAQAMEIDSLKERLATAEAALAAKGTEPQVAKGLPKGALRQCESFSGQKKQKFADWIIQFEAYQTALGTQAESWGPALLTFVSGPASTHLRARFPTGFSQVSYDQLVQALETAQLGRNETDYTLRDKLSSLRLRRGKSGRYNLAQHLHEWDGLLLQCKEPVDPTSACWLLLRTLPASLQSRVATDASGKSWTSLDALRAYVLAVADSWERESAHQPPSSAVVGSQHRDKKARFGDLPKAPQGPKEHNGKPSFVAGRTPKELNALRKKGACFKCGLVGHKAAQCPSGAASKSS